MKARIGDLIPLELQLSDGATGMFPRALIYNAAGTLLATKDLAHVANGRYTNDTYTMPADASANGVYVQVTYLVYSDSGHTTLAPYGASSEVYQRDHEVLSTVSAGATTTVIPCDRTEGASYFVDDLVRAVTGAQKGQTKKISAYTTGQITASTAFAGALSAGDIIEIISR